MVESRADGLAKGDGRAPAPRGVRGGARRPGARGATARRRATHHPRACRAPGRRRKLPRAGQDRRARHLRRQERARNAHAVQLHLRPGPGRRPSGGHRRRRLHRARRLGRRDDQGQAQHVRADGPRAAPAADPSGGGLGRRRLGEDHRDHRPRQRSGRRRLGPGRDQHGHDPARGPRPGLGGRSRRRAPGRRALLGDDQGQVGDVRGRPAGGRAARAEAHQERAGRLGDPAQGRRASTTRSTPRRTRSRCARRFLSYLPSSIDDVPPRGPQTDDPQRREEWLSNAIPRDLRKPYKMRAIVEAVVDRGSFFEMSAALRPRGHHRAAPAWTAGRWR